MLDVAPDTRLDHHNAHHVACGRIAGWACVQTHPQAERWAASQLKRRGYPVYLPLVTVRRRDRATPTITHNIQIPLFPTYLFVAIDRQWTPVRYTPGVHQLLMSEPGKPHIVASAEISALQAAEALRATQPPETAQWHPGAAVAVTAGAFFGHPAVIAHVTRKSAIITILIFGSPRNVTVPLSCLTRRE